MRTRSASSSWTDQHHHSVRSPISVKGVALRAPSEVSGTGATGSQGLSLVAGYTGTLNTSVQGLAQSTVTSIPLVQDGSHGFDPNNPAASDATGRVDVTVPAGTPLVRFATFAGDYPAGTDVDVFVYRTSSLGGSAVAFSGQSAGASASESVTFVPRQTGATYAMFVNVFAAPGGDGSPLTVMPNVFQVPNSNAGNLTVTPASQSVTLGNPASVTLNWSGLASGRYLGIVNYNDGTNAIGSTLVAVDNH